MNKINFGDLLDIIDIHMESEVNLTIVADEYLKDMIVDYLDYVYDIECEDADTNCGEYYIDLAWIDDEFCYFVESARGYSGKYKECDSPEPINYFVFTDMSLEDCQKYLQGTNSARYICELIEEEECNGDCANCQFGEEIDEEEEIINFYTNELLTGDFCPNCGYDFIQEILEVGKQIGYAEAQDDMIQFCDGKLLP